MSQIAREMSIQTAPIDANSGAIWVIPRALHTG